MTYLPPPATSEPARLTGPLGPASPAHEVALVQALLEGAKRSDATPHYAGAIDGRLGPRTAEALTAFRAAAGDGVERPLATGDPLLGRLAQGQRLAVLPGTTTAYVPDFTGGGGSFRDELEPVKLNLNAAARLREVQRDIQAIYGIVLDVVLPAKPFRPDMFVAGPQPVELVALAAFRLRELAVLDSHGRPLVARDVPSFWLLAPDLAEALAQTAERMLAAKLMESFRLDAATQARQRKAFLFPVEREVDGIERFWRRLVELWQSLGFERAAEFLAFYLDGQGRADPEVPDKELSREEALSVAPIREAYKTNIERFNEDSLKSRMHPMRVALWLR